jgi:hypothetical protein
VNNVFKTIIFTTFLNRNERAKKKKESFSIMQIKRKKIMCFFYFYFECRRRKAYEGPSTHGTWIKDGTAVRASNSSDK